MTLEQQLSQLGEELERRHPPVDVAELDPHKPDPSRRTPSAASGSRARRSGAAPDRRSATAAAVPAVPGPALALGIAAVVVFVLGGVALLTGGAPDAASIDSAVPAESPQPAYSSGVVPGAWTPIESWAGPAPSWVNAHPAGGYVAGGIGMPSRFSPDGLVWSTESFDPDLDGLEELYVRGPFALANSVPSQYPYRDSAWIAGFSQAPDFAWETLLEFEGGKWQVLDVGSPVLEIPVRVGGVTLVYPLNPEGTPTDYYLRTTDGVAFERLPMPPGVGGPASRPEFFTHPGGFGLYQETSSLWVSPDGMDWQEVEVKVGIPGGPNPASWVDLGDRILLQGTRTNELGVSPDGVEWVFEEQQLAPWAVGRPWIEERRGVLQASHGAVLVAARRTLVEPSFWHSEDGVVWESIVELPPAAWSNGAAKISVANDLIFYAPSDAEAGVGWVTVIPWSGHPR